jgi:hypothetical protein
VFLEPGRAPGHFEDSNGWRRLGWGIEFHRDRIIHAACSYAVSLKKRGLATVLQLSKIQEA